MDGFGAREHQITCYTVIGASSVSHINATSASDYIPVGGITHKKPTHKIRPSARRTMNRETTIMIGMGRIYS